MSNFSLTFPYAFFFSDAQNAICLERLLKRYDAAFIQLLFVFYRLYLSVAHVYMQFRHGKSGPYKRKRRTEKRLRKSYGTDIKPLDL